MISVSQIDTFRARGVIRMDGLLPADRVSATRDVVLRQVERQGVWKDGGWLLDQLPRTAAPNAGANLVRGVKKARALRELITVEVLDVITTLLDGQAVRPLMDSAQLLFTLPNASEWTVPNTIWHLDAPRLPNRGIPGVQVFTFLDSVKPGGGGTLVAAGSHRLLNGSQRISSKQVKQRLKREPYFRDLMSKTVTDRLRFVNEPGYVGDVEVQVVELYGEPGDVYLVDMRMLHTLAPNASSEPRMMVTQRYVIAELMAELYGMGDEADADSGDVE